MAKASAGRVHGEVVLGAHPDQEHGVGREAVAGPARDQQVLAALAGQPRGPIGLGEVQLAHTGTGLGPLEHGDDQQTRDDPGGGLGGVEVRGHALGSFGG